MHAAVVQSSCRIFSTDQRYPPHPQRWTVVLLSNCTQILKVSLQQVFPNDFWLLKDHMQEINSTTPVLPLYIEVYPTSVLLLFSIVGNGLGMEMADIFVHGLFV